MIDDNELSIAVLPTNKADFSARSGNNRCTHGCFDVLAGMKLIRTAAERIASSAESTLELSDHWPNRRCIAALAQHSFVNVNVLFNLSHFLFQGRKPLLVKRQFGTTGAGQNGFFDNA